MTNVVAAVLPTNKLTKSTPKLLISFGDPIVSIHKTRKKNFSEVLLGIVHKLCNAQIDIFWMYATFVTFLPYIIYGQSFMSEDNIHNYKQPPTFPLIYASCISLCTRAIMSNKLLYINLKLVI